MYKIMDKKSLAPSVSLMEILAPDIVKHAEAGQFIMLRVDQQGERIPLTIADIDRLKQTVSIIFQVVGKTTRDLNQLKIGDELIDFVGPLGRSTDMSNIKKALVIGGGVGCAIAYPIVKKLHKNNIHVDTIIGFRNQSLIFLEEDFKAISHLFYVMTDDGSKGEKGFVTEKLTSLLSQENYDCVFCIGPLPMMKAVSKITKDKQIKTIVSMNPIMVDGTGMCGGCRVSVDGKILFACVDGPEFDGHLIDFDQAIYRNQVYQAFEKEVDEISIKKLGETQ